MTFAVHIPDWYDDAACAGLWPELFFPDGRGREAGQAIKEAVAICKTCPVRDACLTYALEAEWITEGIWGGTTENERRKLLGRAPKLQACSGRRKGTHAGYIAHYYVGEPPCDACKEAHSAYRKQLRDAKKDSA